MVRHSSTERETKNRHVTGNKFYIQYNISAMLKSLTLSDLAFFLYCCMKRLPIQKYCKDVNYKVLYVDVADK